MRFKSSYCEDTTAPGIECLLSRDRFKILEDMQSEKAIVVNLRGSLQGMRRRHDRPAVYLGPSISPKHHLPFQAAPAHPSAPYTVAQLLASTGLLVPSTELGQRKRNETAFVSWEGVADLP